MRIPIALWIATLITSQDLIDSLTYSHVAYLPRSIVMKSSSQIMERRRRRTNSGGSKEKNYGNSRKRDFSEKNRENKL